MGLHHAVIMDISRCFTELVVVLRGNSGTTCGS